MYHYKKNAAILMLALSTAFLAAGCKKQPDKIDLSSTHSTAAGEMTETAGKPAAETTSQADTAPSQAPNVPVSNNDLGQTTLQTYQSGQISIQYPVVEITGSEESSKKISDLLRTNALSVTEAYALNENEDTLNVTCRVISMDRSRLTVVYNAELTKKDATEPTKLFYSNTVDLNKNSNITFSQFADPYTMAGYVLSDDCFFTSLDGALTDTQRQQLAAVKGDRTIEQYTALFKNADFPITPDADTLFPGSFSFEMDGAIIFSIPVPHELGDYALVAYTPETK